MGKAKRQKREHRSLTPTQVKRQQQGSEYLGPGVWIDREGGLHFSVPEILAHLGLPDTPDGRTIAARHIEEAFREQCPDATVVVQDDETPDG